MRYFNSRLSQESNLAYFNYSYHAICLDIKSNKEKWKSKIWRIWPYVLSVLGLSHFQRFYRNTFRRTLKFACQIAVRIGKVWVRYRTSILLFLAPFDFPIPSQCFIPSTHIMYIFMISFNIIKRYLVYVT